MTERLPAAHICLAKWHEVWHNALMKTPNPFTNCSHSSSKRSALLCLSLLIGFLELLPKAQAVSPPPDGGYPGGNTAEGDNALLSLTTGDFNTAVGFYSLSSDTTGGFNTAIGAGTLLFNTGDQNTATGAGALFSNTTGDNNTATGAFALISNTIGYANTANGTFALALNTTGVQNTAVGFQAAFSSTTAGDNTAIGWNALFTNTRGSVNTAVGSQALQSNTTGSGSVAVGWEALQFNTTGRNTAIGAQALEVNTTGSENTAVGVAALGFNMTGNFNTALGTGAGEFVTGDKNIVIGSGNLGVAGENGTIRIGVAPAQTRAFIAGIRAVTTGNNDAVPVLIDSGGQLGTVSSSSRYKTDIKPIEKASESILALQPVSFRYKLHKDTTPNFGLIAEEVARVNPDLVIYDADGKPYTVRYDAVNAMLLNEFLKEHRKVEQQEQKLARQETTIAQLKSAVTKQEATAAEQRKAIAAVTAGLQRVSAQVEMRRPTPHVVVNQQ
jgi:uncharacterized coiled-coil protein SlyX